MLIVSWSTIPTLAQSPGGYMVFGGDSCAVTYCRLLDSFGDGNETRKSLSTNLSSRDDNRICHVMTLMTFTMVPCCHAWAQVFPPGSASVSLVDGEECDEDHEGEGDEACHEGHEEEGDEGHEGCSGS